MGERVPDSATIQLRVDEAVRMFLRDTDTAKSAFELSEQPARPLVLDANRIRGELRRLARPGGDTALCTLTRIGFLQLFAARHVFDEVDRHLGRWAEETGTSLSSMKGAWSSGLRPLIAEVSFSSELLTPDERRRLATLALPPPAGDPDDVPTAIAAMILEAPLLSADGKPLKAVYGPEVDMKQHDAYVESLLAAGRVLVLSQAGRGSVVGAWIIGSLGFDGARALVSRVGLMPSLVLAVAGGSWLLSTQKARAARARLAGTSHAALDMLVEVFGFYQQAEASYRKLRTPVLDDLAELPPRAMAARTEAKDMAMRRAAEMRSPNETKGTSGGETGAA